MVAVLLAAGGLHEHLIITILVALCIAALVYYICSLFLPAPVPLIVALLFLLLVFFGTS